MEATNEPSWTQSAEPKGDKDNGTSNHNNKQQEQQLLYEKARSMWLTGSHLGEVESILYDLWNSGKEGQEAEKVNDSNGRAPKRVKDETGAATTTITNLQNETKINSRESCCTAVVESQVGPRLALWLIQSGRVTEADTILQQLSYECRLSSRILLGGNDDNDAGEHRRQATNGNGFATLQHQQPPCRIFDRFLSDTDLAKLQSVFGDIDSTYWTDHNYSVEPPSPYYSFLIPLRGKEKEQQDSFGFLGSLIERLRDCLLDWQPLLKTCTYCEMWAHNRPSATGHQLHFDTDNEGVCDNSDSSSSSSAVRHPLVTCILYLTDVGGPSLVTNQRKSSRHAADTGWLSHAKVARLMAMDGRVLHCVVPGKATTNPQRRVTVMLAFWRRIKMRGQDGETKPGGAARQFPIDRPWAKALRDSSVVSTPQLDWDKQKDRLHPQPLDHVFENLQGESWPAASGLPSYDCVFQGI